MDVDRRLLRIRSHAREDALGASAKRSRLKPEVQMIRNQPPDVRVVS